MIEAGIVALLTANAPLMALIDPSIYPVLLPESHGDTCLSYQVVSGTATYTLEPKELCQKRIQFDAWSTTYGSAKSVIQALRNALDGYQGTLSDGTRVLSTFRGLDIDFFEDDSRSYRVMQEYIFRFVEP